MAEEEELPPSKKARVTQEEEEELPPEEEEDVPPGVANELPLPSSSSSSSVVLVFAPGASGSTAHKMRQFQDGMLSSRGLHVCRCDDYALGKGEARWVNTQVASGANMRHLLAVLGRAAEVRTSVLTTPSSWCHSSLPWPPGADFSGPWPRYALGTSQRVARAPKGRPKSLQPKTAPMLRHPGAPRVQNLPGRRLLREPRGRRGVALTCRRAAGAEPSALEPSALEPC